MGLLQTIAVPIRPRVIAIALICALPAVPAAFADAPAGHDIAERFAADSERAARQAAERAEQQRQRRIEAEQKRSEAEMLARARAEASAREAAEAVARRQAEENRLAEERRMIEAEKQANARRLEDERQAKVREAAAVAAALEERRRIEAAKQAEEERLKAAVEAQRMADLAKQRAAEAERISQALREAREAHDRRQLAREADARAASTERETPRVAAPTVPPSPEPARLQDDTRFAVLLVMEPGNKGIRRHNKTADPVLCMDQGCYVSNGTAAAASLLPQRKALGIGRTLGERAGACQNSLGCVFRNVEIAGFPNYVQPVDMRVVRHDRREAVTVGSGSECALVRDQLQCRKPIRSGDYVIWLVPEHLAAAAGEAILQRALNDGLPDGDTVAQPVAAWR